MGEHRCRETTRLNNPDQLVCFGSCRVSYVPSILEMGGHEMKYRVHRLDIKMTSDQSKLEQFLNSLDGEVAAIIPNVTV